MDKFLNYGMYEAFLGPVPFRKLAACIRKIFYFDKYKKCSSDLDVKLYRSKLNPNDVPANKTIPILKYIRLGWFSLSDCNWDMDLFDQMKFVCDKVDFLLYNRCLVKFGMYGIVYDEEMIFCDDDFLQLLSEYQFKPIYQTEPGEI